MPVARSTSLPDLSAEGALKAFQGWWSPALAALYSMPSDKDHPWSRMAADAHGAAETAARHWQALAQVQMNAAGEAMTAQLNLATAQAEHRRQALEHVMAIFWPAAAPKPEAARA